MILSLLTILTAYEMLWAMATEDHPQLKAQYRLVDDVSPRVTTESAASNKHYIRGDFDGDREADHALVVASLRSQGYCVLGVLTRGKSSKVVEISCGDHGRPGAVSLALSNSGTPPRRDTLVVTPEDASPSRFEWHPASRSFHEIQPR